jgi:hypothetical protein
MIFSFSVYSRSGACLFHEKWAAGGSAVTYADPEEERRLLFGLLFSLKEFVFKLAPQTPAAATTPQTPAASPYSQAPDASRADVATPMEGLQRYQTDAYTCHHYETPSGLRFVLLTDNQAGDLSAALRYIYAQIYVDTVVSNPLSDVRNAKTINSQLFRAQLKQYLEGLPCSR